MCWTRGFSAGVFVVLVLELQCFAGLVAYDDVNAPEGQLNNVSTGWNMTAWDVQNGNTTTYAVKGPGLGYLNLAVQGNAAGGGGEYLSCGIGISMPAPWETQNEWTFYRYDASGQYMAGADSTTLWMSCILSPWWESNTSFVLLHESNIRWAEGNVAVRLKIDNGVWKIEEKNGATVSSGVAVEPGQNYLMVLKMEFVDTATDRVTLYVNPTPGLVGPDVAATVLDTAANFYFRSIRFYPGQNKFNGFVDEIRFGSSYADVVPAGAANAAAPPEPFRVYYIGNSVTDSINYEALRLMSLEGGKVHAYGRHMIPGTPLDNLWNNPTSGFTNEPYNYYPTALPGWDWSAVSFQPFDRQLASDVNYISRFIDVALTNPNNVDTDYLIYARWPRTSQPGWYDTYWLSDYTGSENETADYFETLTAAMRAEYPDLSIRMVPVGHVMYELNQQMKAGQIPGFTHIQDVYADGIHMNDYGSFIAGCTYYAVLYKQSPAALPSSPYNFEDPNFTAAVQQTVWDVVTSHPLTGVGRTGDFEPDGDVDGDDLSYFMERWLNADCNDTNGFCLGADINGDGHVRFDDYAFLSENWRLGPYTP